MTLLLVDWTARQVDPQLNEFYSFGLTRSGFKRIASTYGHPEIYWNSYSEQEGIDATNRGIAFDSTVCMLDLHGRLHALGEIPSEVRDDLKRVMDRLSRSLYLKPLEWEPLRVGPALPRKDLDAMSQTGERMAPSLGRIYLHRRTELANTEKNLMEPLYKETEDKIMRNLALKGVKAGGDSHEAGGEDAQDWDVVDEVNGSMSACTLTIKERQSTPSPDFDPRSEDAEGEADWETPSSSYINTPRSTKTKFEPSSAGRPSASSSIRATLGRSQPDSASLHPPRFESKLSRSGSNGSAASGSRSITSRASSSASTGRRTINTREGEDDDEAPVKTRSAADFRSPSISRGKAGDGPSAKKRSRLIHQ